MRISRALALAGIDSRRKCEAFVLAGEVKVNGKIIDNLATQVDIEKDHIFFRERILVFEHSTYYILFKPTGFTTTASDPHAKKTVYEILPRKLTSKSAARKSDKTRVFPVGRLDRDSSGLLLFTNDGELSNRLLHPRYGVTKIYEVRLHRPLEVKDKKKILAGVRLKDGIAKIQRVKNVTKRVVHVWIKEGKKREVRRLFKELDYTVQTLCRIAFGPLTLGALQPGEGRFLTKSEATELKSLLQTGDRKGEDGKIGKKR